MAVAGDWLGSYCTEMTLKIKSQAGIELLLPNMTKTLLDYPPLENIYKTRISYKKEPPEYTGMHKEAG